MVIYCSSLNMHRILKKSPLGMDDVELHKLQHAPMDHGRLARESRKPERHSVDNSNYYQTRRIYRRKQSNQGYKFVMIAFVWLTFVSSTLSIDWCNMDSGFTTIMDSDRYPRNVYVSVRRDGTVWMRIGPEHRSLDWMRKNEHVHKTQSPLLRQSDINILEDTYYSEFCVLSDIDLFMSASSGWHPSYIVTYNPLSKATRILLFKYTRDCSISTNLTVSRDKHALICNGGNINSCGLKNLPYKGHSTGPVFLKYVKFDPKGPDSYVCSSPASRNIYTFTGSYYHVYVKVAKCSVPGDSRILGYEAKLRPERDTLSDYVFILDPTQTALQGGIIKGWKVFVKMTSLDHEAYLQIWRPSSREQKRYSLIGQTLFRPADLRFHEIMLAPDELIYAKKGDVLGIYFKKLNPIAWSMVPCANEDQRMLFVHKPGFTALGDQLTFTVPPLTWDLCRQYSLTAIFANKDKLKIVEDWKCPKADLLPPDTRKRSETTTRKNSLSSRRSHRRSKYLVMKRRKKSKKGGLPTYVILVIVGITLAILILVGFVSFYCYTHKSERQAREAREKTKQESEHYSQSK